MVQECCLCGFPGDINIYKNNTKTFEIEIKNIIVVYCYYVTGFFLTLVMIVIS